jgi:hypothetical protein
MREDSCFARTLSISRTAPAPNSFY